VRYNPFIGWRFTRTRPVQAKLEWRKDMSVGVMIELKVEDIANGIKKLGKKDRETLLLLLSGEGREIKKRLKEIETGKVKTLTREEILKHVL
jgi:hypothetical protein